MSKIDDVFNDILSLEDNWDGYGAESFEPDYVAKCRDIVKGLEIEPFIAPTPANTIQIEYENGDNYLEIEFLEDRAEVFKMNGDGTFLNFVVLEPNSEVINFLIDSFYNK